MEIKEVYTLFKSCSSVSIDTRTVQEGALFFALKGPRFDANTYAETAISKGARYAIIDNPVYRLDDRYILVEDVLSTLQSLASYHREMFDIPFLAITGSNGKTTTKELITSILSKKYKVCATRGNYNNHIGVPLTLLSITENTEIAVIEMGANHIGEIYKYGVWVRPTIGLITNIGRAHLEGFGGIEGVKKAKTELYVTIKKNKGTVIVNRDDRFLFDKSTSIADRFTYGTDHADVIAQLIGMSPYLLVEYMGEQIATRLVGVYNFQNILAAIAVGHYMHVALSDIKEALENYVPSNNRSQHLQQGTNTILLDAYNANPSSMMAAINTFAHNESNKKIAILGSMKELGTYSSKEHLYIAKEADARKFEKLVLVGEEFEQASQKVKCLYFRDVSMLKKWYQSVSFINTNILIKGSRSMSLEKILE